MAVDDLPPLRDVIAAHHLRAEKKLGQNFLLDQNITDKIARHAAQGVDDFSEHTVFEIGLTPNRSDATSHIGVARDLAAALQINKGLNN
ncbi:MAG: hypothetical protein ACPGRX_06310, partial [Bdellovibrionales bacterium]